ncbi:MAG: hypothetical protein Tsb002_07790 [Wenzhouxiangellaceae bacterium]
MTTSFKSLGVFAFSLCLASTALAQSKQDLASELDPIDSRSHGHTMTANVRALAVNGWNRRFGSPATDQLRFVGDLQFAVGGVFNPSGPALEINNSTSPDALLASYAAPDVYLAFFGVPDAELTPDQNIPYIDYPQIFKHDGTAGALQPVMENPEWWDYSNGAQTQGYTVADWLSARGVMRFVCSEREGNYYQVFMRNMIPGGLYTLWGFYFDQQQGMLQQDFPFGGTSANVFVADRDGKIRGSRDINFCPMTWDDSAPQQLVNIFAVYHPDGRVNAAVGHTVQIPPFIGPGMTATPQLMFPMPQEF